MTEARRKPQEGADPKRLLIVIYQGLGDLVLATPVLKAIRQRFPKAHLALAGRRGPLPILSHERYIDELIALSSLTEVRAWVRAISMLRQRRFDLLVNLTTPLDPRTWLKCQLFNALIGARRIISPAWKDCLLYVGRREAVRFRYLLHETALKFRYARAIVSPPSILVPTLESRDDRYLPESVAQLRRRARCLVGVAPGGAKQTHQWPLNCFIECLRHIQKRRADVAFILVGDAGDKPLAQAIGQRVAGPVVNLVANSSTECLPALIRSFAAFLGNDSGLMHVAAAVGTPLVAIFGGGTPSRYRPVSSGAPAQVFFRPFACGPCLRRACSHRSCMKWIDPAQVAGALIRMLPSPAESPGAIAATDTIERSTGIHACLSSPALGTNAPSGAED